VPVIFTEWFVLFFWSKVAKQSPTAAHLFFAARLDTQTSLISSRYAKN
jgi:hypothetical protein